MFAELDALELDGVEPMAHAVPLHNVFRGWNKTIPDHDLALSNAPEAEDGYLKYLALHKNRGFRCGNNSWITQETSE